MSLRTGIVGIAWHQLTLDSGPDLVVHRALDFDGDHQAPVERLDVDALVVGHVPLRLENDAEGIEARRKDADEEITAGLLRAWVPRSSIMVDVPELLVEVVLRMTDVGGEIPEVDDEKRVKVSDARRLSGA